MQIVNLYTLKVERIPTYNRDYLIQNRVLDIRNSYLVDNDTIVDKSVIEHIEIPIRKYCWANGKEVLAAFDKEVLELIGVDQESFESKVRYEAAKLAKIKVKEVEEKLNQLLDMSFWQRVKWAFKALNRG